jgi:hypothetical protein
MRLTPQRRGRFEDVVAALDIERQDLLPLGLGGLAGQMHNAIDAGRRLLHGRRVADVGGEDFLALLGGAERRNVKQANEWVRTAQALPEGFADLAGRAGDENARHAGGSEAVGVLPKRRSYARI